MKTLARLLPLLLLLNACVGPLVSHETARSVGRGRTEVAAGFGQAGYVGKVSYGLGSDWDLGLQWESLSLGLRTKYAFINARENGLSFAVALGGGVSNYGTNHYYGDIHVSYLRRQIEPYAVLRLSHVHANPSRITNRYTGDVNYYIREQTNFDYGQAIIGSRVWFGEHLSASGEVSAPIAFTHRIQMSQALLLGTALAYRF